MSRLASGPLDDWFGAVRRLERAVGRRPRVGRAGRPADEPVRFTHPPSLEFAPTAVWGIDAVAGGRLTVRSAVLGLWGPQGALPLHLTEYALGQRHARKDRTLEAFADVFHHRMLSLLYRAWAETQPCVQADRPADDAFAGYLGAVTGVAPGEPGAGVVRFAAGHFATRSRHAEGLRALTSVVLGVAVRIEEHLPERLPVDDAMRCRLNRTRVGHTGVLGRTVRVASSRFRLRIGPLPWRRYAALSSRGPAWHALVVAVRRYAGASHAWDARLCLQRHDVPDARLGGDARLGHSCWIGSLATDVDPDPLVLEGAVPGLAPPTRMFP
ncbi:type VI secretion system baseplate subunit TssG [Luteibacter sp. PPL554]